MPESFLPVIPIPAIHIVDSVTIATMFLMIKKNFSFIMLTDTPQNDKSHPLAYVLIRVAVFCTFHSFYCPWQMN